MTMAGESDMNYSNCRLILQAQHHIPEPSSVAVALRTTNLPPRHSDRGVLENHRLTVRSHINHVTDDISRVEEFLGGLRQELRLLHDAADTHDSVLHPIRVLTDDILSCIFRECVQDSGMTELYNNSANGPFCYDSLNTKKSPWTLSQVCQRWRAVAISDPALWSYVGIVFPGPGLGFQHRVKILNLLTLQLQRSRQQPLSISLRSEHTIDGLNPFLIAICIHCDRWVKLRVHSSKAFPETLRSLSSLIKGKIPALRYLHLEPGRYLAGNIQVVIDGFQDAPNLRDLTIWGFTGRLTNALRILWVQITRFRTCDQGLKVEQPLDLQALSSMPNLKALHLNRKFGDSLALPSVVNLPSLHTLAISVLPIGNGVPRYSTVSSLLERLTLSALRDLRIDATTRIVHLPQFLSSSASTLRVLKLRVMESSTVVPLLGCVPGLEHLALRGTSSEALDALAQRDPCLLPRLRKLDLWQLEDKDLDESLLLLVAETRVRLESNSTASESLIDSIRDPHLQFLEIDNDYNLSDSTLQSLQALKARGLEFRQSACGWFFHSPEQTWK